MFVMRGDWVLHDLVVHLADSRTIQEVVATVLSIERIVKLARIFMDEVRVVHQRKA